VPAAALLRCANAGGLAFAAPTGGGQALVAHRPAPDGGAWSGCGRDRGDPCAERCGWAPLRMPRRRRPCVVSCPALRSRAPLCGGRFSDSRSLLEGDHAGSTTWALTPPAARTAPQEGIEAQGSLEDAAVPLGSAARALPVPTAPGLSASIQRRPFADLAYHASDRARARGGAGRVKLACRLLRGRRAAGHRSPARGSLNGATIGAAPSWGGTT